MVASNSSGAVVCRLWMIRQRRSALRKVETVPGVSEMVLASRLVASSLRRASGEQDLEEVFVKAIQGHAGRGGTEGNVADTGAPDA